MVLDIVGRKKNNGNTPSPVGTTVLISIFELVLIKILPLRSLKGSLSNTKFWYRVDIVGRKKNNGNTPSPVGTIVLISIFELVLIKILPLRSLRVY